MGIVCNGVKRFSCNSRLCQEEDKGGWEGDTPAITREESLDEGMEENMQELEYSPWRRARRKSKGRGRRKRRDSTKKKTWLHHVRGRGGGEWEGISYMHWKELLSLERGLITRWHILHSIQFVCSLVWQCIIQF